MGYARTWAPAIAGEAKAVFFNVTSSDFRLEYVIKKSDPAVPTEIFVWPDRYPGGADVAATASDGSVRVEYDGTGRQVLVYADQGVKEGTRVVVKISRKAADMIV